MTMVEVVKVTAVTVVTVGVVSHGGDRFHKFSSENYHA
jgi:hypothetical protein